MTNRVRLFGLSAAVVATVVSGAGTASVQAATAGAGKHLLSAPDTAGAKPSGYKVVFSAPISAPNGGQTFGSVTCPPTGGGVARQPQGGGVVISSSSTGASINSSEPAGTSWDADVNNSSGADTTFRVYAVCAKPKTGYTVVEASGLPNGAGVQSGDTVICPAHTRILGGGGFSSSGAVTVNMNSSYPVSNGWHIDMNNASGSDTTFNVYAICSKYSTNIPPGYTVVGGTATDNPPGAQTFASVGCPAGESPLGGGGYSTSANTSINLNTSAPLTNGWAVYENNASAVDANITAIVVCAS